MLYFRVHSVRDSMTYNVYVQAEFFFCLFLFIFFFYRAIYIVLTSESTGCDKFCTRISLQLISLVGIPGSFKGFGVWGLG